MPMPMLTSLLSAARVSGTSAANAISGSLIARVAVSVPPIIAPNSSARVSPRPVIDAEVRMSKSLAPKASPMDPTQVRMRSRAATRPASSSGHAHLRATSSKPAFQARVADLGSMSLRRAMRYTW